MSQFISIDNIDGLATTEISPLYVMVAGGMAVGKSHIVENKVKSLCLLDVDKFMEKMGFLDYTPEQFSIAMNEISKFFDEYMNDGVSIVAMGTASNTSTAINRLYEAKQKGYKTVLLYIEASVNQALKQNQERIEQGKRGVSKAEEYKIERTNVGAANTVATLRETALVDYFSHYINIRNGEDNE